VPVSFGSSCLIGLAVTGVPTPWQQLVEPLRGILGDAGEHVGEPGQGIDVIELCRMISVAMTAARSAPRSEPAWFASQCKSAQGALSRVVREADAAVFDEPREPISALEHVVDWLGDRGRTRNTGTLLT
jgi:hypothetical protein